MEPLWLKESIDSEFLLFPKGNLLPMPPQSAKRTQHQKRGILKAGKDNSELALDRLQLTER